MTNKEDDSDSSGEPGVAALLAVRLVKQVLDEAHVIVNGATESDFQWNSVDNIPAVKTSEHKDLQKHLNFHAQGKDRTISNIYAKEVLNVTNIATSTPQKIKDLKTPDTTFIGQGDSGFSFDMENQNETSTSLYINNLFDMTEVEKAIASEASPENQQNDENEPKQHLTEAMNSIMVSYVNTALSIAFMQDVLKTETEVENQSPITNGSSDSVLADVCDTDVYNAMGDVAFCIDNGARNDSDKEESVLKPTETSEVSEAQREELNKNDITHFENAYITLNRDFDQCSVGDRDFVQDPKGVLQDVELPLAQTSNKNSLEAISCENKELKAESIITPSEHSRKSSLAQRCRTQGSRLLACLRGWWRRKTPGKRKEPRLPGSVRGHCPLSPDARRRAASLLDERRLNKSSSSSRQVIWKFNTVSEALVNSSRWNYTFDLQHDGFN